MDEQFWKKAWNEGKTNFHLKTVHEKLAEHFSKLNAKPGQRVLVPLCGKTKDLLWLKAQGLRVHGVELHAQAVEEFFAENGLGPVERTRDQDFSRYSHGDIEVSCGDFFKLKQDGSYDLVYDRASLVALPSSMRAGYAEVIRGALRAGGKCLLIVYEYDPSKMEGPPFSVETDEIHRLYGRHFAIELVESQKPTQEGPRLAAVEDLVQKVYVLEKVSGKA
jgi:thiopurine S-methyltransferase